MSILDLSSADFTFSTESLAKNELRVRSFTGQEHLSQPFCFQVVIVADRPDVDLDAPVGQAAVLAIRGRSLTGVPYTRHVHGVIERFEQLSVGKKYSHYEATLVPTMLPLRYTRNSRIFQQLSAVQIVQKVLQEGKVPAESVNLLLHDSYGPRDFCVQYQESNLDFMARLLEEEGIFYFFEHSADKDKLQLGDGKHSIDNLPHGSELSFRSEPHLYEEVIYQFRAESVIRPGGTILRDFRFKHPTLDMEAQESAAQFTDYQMYYFPGEYVDPVMGKHLAQIRMEELQSDRRRFFAVSSCRGLVPGYKFVLKNHRRPDFCQEYLIVAVEHQASQPQVLKEEQADAGSGADLQLTYTSKIVCIPASLSYRPRRSTPRPSVLGVQSAIVVGPSGEEIHCDEHGRIKVQFHWDREGNKDDNSSCWIRVSQPWGGAGQGGMFIPRVGQEVLVQFLEGDPDRPIIVGRVYNGENPVPHGLPAAKVISTIRSSSSPGGGGFNEIKFDDSAGNEEMFIHAQFNRNEIVGHNHDTKVAVDQSLAVGSNQSGQIGVNQTLSVGANQSTQVGAEQSLSVGGNRSQSVAGNEDVAVNGNQSVAVTGNQTVAVTGNQSVAVTQNQDTNVTGNQTLTVLGTQDIKVLGGSAALTINNAYTVDATSTIVIQAPTSITLTCGGSSISMVPGQIILQAGGGASLVLDINAVITGLLAQMQGGAQAAITAPTVDVSGTKVQVGNDTITIAGTKIDISGSASASVVGGDAGLALAGTADLSGTSTSVSGSSAAKLTGGGSVDISGGIVKIN